jgi:hypothetical protein
MRRATVVVALLCCLFISPSARAEEPPRRTALEVSASVAVCLSERIGAPIRLEGYPWSGELYDEAYLVGQITTVKEIDGHTEMSAYAYDDEDPGRSREYVAARGRVFMSCYEPEQVD